MARSCFFGPAPPDWAAQHLPGRVRNGLCLPFDFRPADPAQEPPSSWEAVVARLPRSPAPEFLALNLAGSALPPWVWRAPLPIVGLLRDWDLDWHYHRLVVPHCDLVLTDAAGVERLRQQGFGHVHRANLVGVESARAEQDLPEGERDVDVLLLGSLHLAMDRRRLQVLGKLLGMADRRKIVVHQDVNPTTYRPLVERAKLVIVQTRAGEWRREALEVLAGGAALLIDEVDAAVRLDCLRDGETCVYYRPDDLATLAGQYLADDAGRRAIAERGRALRAEMTFEAGWTAAMATVEREWPALAERAARRQAAAGPDVHTRSWAVAVRGRAADPGLVGDLAAAVAARPHDAELHSALGVAVACPGTGEALVDAAAAQAAVDHFQRAVTADPAHLVAALNLVEALVGLDDKERAAGHARRALRELEALPQVPAEVLGGCRFPPGLDFFRVAWERAAWENAGRPADETRVKLGLLRWRLHLLLAELTGELHHFHEAVLAGPDFPGSRAALGCALGRAGRPLEALPHLRRAVQGDPLDLPAARALYHALGEVEDHVGRRDLARAAAALSRLGLVPSQPWFDEAVPDGDLPGDAFPTRPGKDGHVGNVPHGPMRLVWQGSQEALHSFAIVNRHVSERLLRRGHELTLATPPEPAASRVELRPELRERLNRPLSGPADVTIAHQWPPDWRPPPHGHWVVAQPWEFGSLPREWVGPLRDAVDEVWVPSAFVRAGFIHSGVPAEQVHVVPWGVSEAFLHPTGPPYALATAKAFKFLFVGGMIHRKGIDLLLHAYCQAFTARDDVCLVIKETGARSFYQGQTMHELLARLRESPDAPEIVLLSDDLGEDDLARLYRACDCLVQPYRGEGFCLPVLEAMACGLATVVTGFGPALDYGSAEATYFLPARVHRLKQAKVGEWETVEPPFLAEPDFDSLRHRLRHVFEEKAEAAARGRRAAEAVRETWTWDRTAAVIDARLARLRGRPIRRLRVPAAAAAAPPAADRPRVSLCMIVKNEEHNLPQCLASVRDLVDDVVVVDTGSTDRTRQIAASMGARVFDFPWVDSFAAARNETLRHARGEWIFWMDADDRLDEESRAKLRDLLARLPAENVAYSMKCLCLPDHATGTATVVDHIRLFRNDPRLRWKYRVHEQILGAVREAGGEIRWADVVIHHTGYQDSARRAAKRQRDLRLLQLDHHDQPNDPFTLFNLGWVLCELGRPEEAVPHLRASLAQSPDGNSVTRKTYALLIHCHRQLGQQREALAACREGRWRCPDDVELRFEEGVLQYEQGNLPAAEACFVQMLHLPAGSYFGSVDPALRGYKARHQLGVIYHRQGRHAEARQQWEAALAERGDYVPSLVGLGELLLTQQRWAELDALVRRLRESRGGAMEADVLAARVLTARGNFDAARDLLNACAAANPDAVWPRLMLSHAALQEGRDIGAAEQALRDVLRLVPDHAPTQRNLQVLLQRKQHGETTP